MSLDTLLKDVGSYGFMLRDKLPQIVLFFDTANECIRSLNEIGFYFDLKPD